MSVIKRQILRHLDLTLDEALADPNAPMAESPRWQDVTLALSAPHASSRWSRPTSNATPQDQAERCRVERPQPQHRAARIADPEECGVSLGHLERNRKANDVAEEAHRPLDIAHRQGASRRGREPRSGQSLPPISNFPCGEARLPSERRADGAQPPQRPKFATLPAPWLGRLDRCDVSISPLLVRRTARGVPRSRGARMKVSTLEPRGMKCESMNAQVRQIGAVCDASRVTWVRCGVSVKTRCAITCAQSTQRGV